MGAGGCGGFGTGVALDAGGSGEGARCCGSEACGGGEGGEEEEEEEEKKGRNGGLGGHGFQMGFDE